jgi:hypothetical protein
MILKNRRKIQRKIGAFDSKQNKAKLWKILITTLFFLRKTPFFRQNLSKIAEKCDHNIDPSWRIKTLRKYLS